MTDVRSHFPQDKKETRNGIHTDGERGGKSLRITLCVTGVSRPVVSRVATWSHLRRGWHFFPSQLKVYKDGHSQSTCFLLRKTWWELTRTHSSKHLKWTLWWLRKTEASGTSRGLWQVSCRLSWTSWDSGPLILQSWPLWPGSFVEHDGSKQTYGIIPENDRSKYTHSHWGGKRGDPQGCLSWGAHASWFLPFTLLLSFYYFFGGGARNIHLKD